jgi:hypothetical protein
MARIDFGSEDLTDVYGLAIPEKARDREDSPPE